MGDGDVLKCLRMLTFLPIEQIDEMDKWEGSQLNTAKEILAFELTKLVHGEEEAQKAQEAAKALFVGGGDMSLSLIHILKTLAAPVLEHRLILDSGARFSGVSVSAILDDVLERLQGAPELEAVAHEK